MCSRSYFIGHIIYNKMHCTAGAIGTEGGWKKITRLWLLLPTDNMRCENSPFQKVAVIVALFSQYHRYVHFIKALFTFLWCLMSYVNVKLNDQMFF